MNYEQPSELPLRQPNIKVFVYGTLKPSEANYQQYCAGKVIQEIRAYTWGQLFDLPLGYPAMTEGNSQVEGFLLTFASSLILESLDKLEDYQPQRSPQENEYDRRLIPIYCLAGESLGQAWGYLMSRERVKQLGGISLNSGWWTGVRD
jgi:gamma-glutamylcyclotransferase (GGCT)/AIG2-like uncharacterized protein YtfP